MAAYNLKIFLICILHSTLPPPGYYLSCPCMADINRHYYWLRVYTVSRWWCPYVCNDGYFEILASHLTFFTDAIASMYRKNRYIVMRCCPYKNIFKIHLRNSYVCFAKSVFSYAEKIWALHIEQALFCYSFNISILFLYLSPLKIYSYIIW